MGGDFSFLATRQNGQKQNETIENNKRSVSGLSQKLYLPTRSSSHSEARVRIRRQRSIVKMLLALLKTDVKVLITAANSAASISPLTPEHTVCTSFVYNSSLTSAVYFYLHIHKIKLIR